MTQQHHDETRTERLDRTESMGPVEDERDYRDDRTVGASRTADVEASYRGFKGGAAFYGWLVAVGLVALLTGIVGAIAAAVDYAATIDWNSAKNNADTAGTIGIASGAVLLLILVIAYYNGGYVAGRLARFDGARQGFGVWIIGVVVTAVVAAIAAVAGSQYDVLDRVDLPSVALADNTLSTGGFVALVAAVVLTLLAAVIGGKAGQRYHRRIDDITG